MMTLAKYRKLKGLSLKGFGAMIGKSKGHVHAIEKGNQCSAKVALDIERVTDGDVNAATLNNEIAAARRIAA